MPRRYASAVEQLILWTVRAHQDDEASNTGGILARCARDGVRTVLGTCAGGELGDDPGATKAEPPATAPGERQGPGGRSSKKA